MSNKTVHTPNSIEECFAALNSLLTVVERESILSMTEMEFTNTNHHGLGTWIRDNWIRQTEVPTNFIQFLHDNGARHIDDISSIILTCYYRHLKGTDIQLGSQLDYYKNYWLTHTRPQPEQYPEGLKKASLYAERDYPMGKDKASCLSIFKDQTTDALWLYDYYFGWQHITKQDADKLLGSSDEKILEELTEIIFKDI